MFLPFLFDATIPLYFIIDKCWEMLAWLNFVFSISSVTDISLPLNRFKISNLTWFESTLHISACSLYSSFINSNPAVAFSFYHAPYLNLRCEMQCVKSQNYYPA